MIEAGNTGTYKEEASGKTISLSQDEYITAVTHYTSGEVLSVQVTPFTNLARCYAEYLIENESESVDDALNRANSKIAAIAGVEIINTKPIDVTDINSANIELTPGIKYGFLTAGISQTMLDVSEANSQPPHSQKFLTSIIWSKMACNDIKHDGLLDGVGITDSTSGQLSFGTYKITAETYRNVLAQKILSFVKSENNATGIDIQKTLVFANALSTNTDSVWAGLPAKSVDDVGPTITFQLAENSFIGGAAKIGVTVTDPVGVANIDFYVDNALVSNNDGSSVLYSLNTLNYQDGEHTIKIRAIDAIGNESIKEIIYQITNTLAGVNLTSSTIVNSINYRAEGNWVGVESAIKSISIGDVDATLNHEEETWSADIELKDGKNNISVTMIDEVNNKTSKSFEVGVDLFNLLFLETDKSAPYTSGQGYYNLCEFKKFEDNKGTALCIRNDKVSLNGIVVDDNLEKKDILSLDFTVEDFFGEGVYSLFDGMSVFYKYTKNDELVFDYKPLNTGRQISKGKGFYVLPFTTEFFGADFANTIPSDTHTFDLELHDEAGNITDVKYTLSFEILKAVEDTLKPSFTVTSKTLVNNIEYEVTGTWTSPGIEMAEILVNDVLATINDDGTWSATLRLESGRNDIVITAKNILNNTTVEQTRVNVDSFTPIIISKNIYYSESSGQNFYNLCTSQIFSNIDNKTVCIREDKTDLGTTELDNIKMTEGDYFFFDFQVEDSPAEVFSGFEDIVVDYRHEKNNVIEQDWIVLNTGVMATYTNARGQYLLPVTTEFFGAGLFASTSSDLHKITIRATDKSGNISTKTYNLKFDVVPFVDPATAPTVTMDSDTLTTQTNYSAYGSWTSPVVGLIDIMVGGVPAKINKVDDNHGTWTAQLTLESGLHDISVIATNLIKNQAEINTEIAIDTHAPFISHSASNLLLSTNRGTYHSCTSGRFTGSTQVSPICIRHDKVSLNLNGRELKENDLDDEMYLRLWIGDSSVDEAYTEFNDMVFEYKYSRNNTQIRNWTVLNTGTLGSDRISGHIFLPFATEFLDDDWYKTSDTDIHKFEIRATDEAGHTTTFTSNIRFDVVIYDQAPDLLNITTSSNADTILNKEFVERHTISNNTITSSTFINNNSTTPLVMKFSSTDESGIIKTHEIAQRMNRAGLHTQEMWSVEGIETPRVYTYRNKTWSTLQPSSTTAQYERVFSDTVDVPDSTTPTRNTDFPCNEFQGYRNRTPISVDYALSTASYTSHYGRGADLTIIGSVPAAGCKTVQTSPLAASRITTNTFLKWYEYDMRYVPGFPRNNSYTSIEFYDLNTHTLVFDKTTAQKIPSIRGFYNIEAGHTVEIRKTITIPPISFYNDLAVADLSTFRSYTSSTLDKETVFNIDERINVELASSEFAAPTYRKTGTKNTSAIIR